MPPRRRTVLSTVASLSMAGIAGCSAATERLGDAVQGVRSPALEDQKAVVDRFIAGVNENDVDAVNETTTMWADGGFTEETIGAYSLERGTLRQTHSEDGYATLKTQLSITEDGETRTDETSFRLSETTEGWVIWEILIVGGFLVGGTTLGTLAVSLDPSYDPDATSSDGTGVLTLTHRSEATVPASGMSVHGTITDPEDADPDITTDGATVAEATGQSRFSSGDTLTIGVEHEYEVSVVYSKEGTNNALIGQFSHS